MYCIIKRIFTIYPLGLLNLLTELKQNLQLNLDLRTMTLWMSFVWGSLFCGLLRVILWSLQCAVCELDETATQPPVMYLLRWRAFYISLSSLFVSPPFLLSSSISTDKKRTKLYRRLALCLVLTVFTTFLWINVFLVIVRLGEECFYGKVEAKTEVLI